MKALLSLEQLEERNLCTVTATWFAAKLNDAGVRASAQTHYLDDDQIDRGEIVAVFRKASADGVVNGAEVHDLKMLAVNSEQLSMPDDVANLAYKTVHYNRANKRYLGGTLAASGYLEAGDDGAVLDKLVNKWFFGKDHPANTHDDGYAKAAGSVFGADGPKASDIDQGATGDCYFLAALGAVARNNPIAIENMFGFNHDGTYSVRFFGDNGTASYVTVDRYFPQDNGAFVEANRDSYLSDPDNVLWVALVEKAYAQLAEEGWSRAYQAQWNSAWNTNSYRALSFGDDTISLSQITGKQADCWYFSWGAGAAKRNELIQQIQAHDAVTAWTVPTSQRPDDMPGGVISYHVYTVTGYNPTAQTFTLQNPYEWGTRMLHLTWSQLTRWFGGWSHVQVIGPIMAM